MKNVSICTKLKKIDLLILLAKTIRINSNDLSIIELNKICEGIWLNCLQLKEDRIYFEDMAKSLDYYRRTSLFLFK